MPPPETLTIILPAYNEAERIEPALDELFGYLGRRGERAREGAPGSAELPPRIEVLVVDDGSTDATAAIVAARPEAAPAADVAGAHLRVMTVPHGGKGAAVRAGHARRRRRTSIVFADADMATPPDQLPLLVAALADHDVALGSRIQPDGSDMRASQPGYRRLLGKVFHLLASIWVVGPVKDTQCGFKGFTRAAAHDLFARQQITSIVFDVELIYLARRRGYRIAIVPIRWADRRGSRMRARPGLAVRVAWDLFRIPLVHRKARRSSRRREDHARPARRVKRGDDRRPGRCVAVSAVVYWLANRGFDAGRGDFFYLADAFLHGRTWLDVPARPVRRDHRRRPVLRAVRAVPGDRADAARRGHRRRSPPTRSRPGSTRSSPPRGVGLCWWLLGRIGVPRLVDRLWLASCSASRPRSCGSRRAAASGTPAISSRRS